MLVKSKIFTECISAIKVSSEDATSYTELMNAIPMTGSGAKEEVKLGLRNAIKTRRVAQGLEGLPIIEEKRPKIDTVSQATLGPLSEKMSSISIQS